VIPPHERRILEAFIRGVALSRLDLEERPLNEYEQAELKRLTKMRVQGLPLQYLTGSQGFYGREFYINTQVLVPRPETEGLVELALKELKRIQTVVEKPQVLDFGTGSGCIALTVALENPNTRVFAADCSKEALDVAIENARRFRTVNVEFLPTSEEPELWQFGDLPKLDMIISNPPYLMQTEELATDVRAHEPPEALFAPEDDAIFFYRFLGGLMLEKLNPKGVGLFEIAEQRGKETAQAFIDLGFKAQILRDLTDRDRYLLVKYEDNE